MHSSCLYMTTMWELSRDFLSIKSVNNKPLPFCVSPKRKTERRDKWDFLGYCGTIWDRTIEVFFPT